MKLGYCCINLSLRDQAVSVNRGMIKKTWQAQGVSRAGALAEQNLRDLLTILQWNLDHEIYVYRMSSDIFPWMSEYSLESLPNFEDLRDHMAKIGDYANWHGIRLSFHPGQFDVLASPNNEVVKKTIWDLDQHARIMDYMGLPKNYSSAINLHIGGTYGDKQSALDRFCQNFDQLSDSTQSRLVVENDDKASQFGVADLYEGVYMRIGCPITFDHFHHRFCTNNISAETAARLASTTWHKYRPLQHYSSSKFLYEDTSVINRAHADYIYELIPDYGLDADVEIEAKAKDFALLKYRKDFLNKTFVSPQLFEFEKA